MSAAPISEELIQGYVDEQLDDAQRTEVERYLAREPAAAERVESYRRQRLSIKAAYEDVLREPVPSAMHGFRARRSIYPWHFGTIWGVPSKVVAFLACLLGATFPLTGFLMYRASRRSETT